MKDVTKTVRTWLVNGALTLISFAVGYVLLEVAVRALTPGIGFVWRNFATDPINLIRTVPMIQHDPELGWVLVPNRADFGFGPLGNRLNFATKPSDPIPPVAPHSILAIGDSFTFGSEVNADESWPAQLERMLNASVVNGGIGGYGIDQMVLWVDRIVDKVKPSIILFSFIPPDIERARMSVFSGAEKPYFQIADGKLVLRNTPVPFYEPKFNAVGLRAIFGYSYLIAWTAERLSLQNQWQLRDYRYQTVDVDPIRVSCLLMARLKQITSAKDVPVIIVAQSGWSDFNPAGQGARDNQQKVLDCARTQNFVIVDIYDRLKPLIDAGGKEALARYYVKGVGHMTKEGNNLVAKEIARAIEAQFPAVKEISPPPGR